MNSYVNIFNICAVKMQEIWVEVNQNVQIYRYENEVQEG